MIPPSGDLTSDVSCGRALSSITQHFADYAAVVSDRTRQQNGGGIVAGLLIFSIRGTSVAGSVQPVRVKWGEMVDATGAYWCRFLHCPRSGPRSVLAATVNADYTGPTFRVCTRSHVGTLTLRSTLN